MVKWHKYPAEKPLHNGEYLVRGIGCLTHKLHYWLCLWVDVEDLPTDFYYNGNYFATTTVVHGAKKAFG